MKKIIVILGIFLFLLALSTTVSYAQVTPTPTSVPQYSKFETSLNLQPAPVFDNPFNPDDVKVLVYFTSPSNKVITVPAFWYQAYSGPNGSLVGNPYWMVRFTPSEVGQYSFYTVVTDRNGTRTTASQTFQSTASNNKGFVKVSNVNPRYFSFEKDGSTFYPIGHNVAWNTPDPLNIYDAYFSKMSQNGENFTRLDAGIFSWVELENEYNPIGRYDLKNAYNLDYILNLASQYHIYANLTLEWSDYFMSDKQAWLTHNPYNSVRGGPIANPWEFWTNTEAKRLFKQRLYYLIARYSYSPNILYWETLNEIETTTGYADHVNEVLAWSREMMAYLHQTDPNNHPVSQSFSGGWGNSALNNDANMNVVQSHRYDNYKDYGQAFYQLSRAFIDNYPKPNIIGEFGLDAVDGNSDRLDTQGIHLTTAIWGSLFGGASGTPQSWWWKDYINGQNQYVKFKGLANFLKDVDLAKHNYVPENFVVSSSSPTQRIKDVRLQGVMGSWNTINMSEALQPITVTVASDGMIKNAGLLNQRLFNTKWYYDNQKLFKNPVTFAVDYLSDNKFAVYVNETTSGSSLKISLDGIVKFQNTVSTGISYSIDIPAGQHQITVECVSGSWIIPEYHFYLPTQTPPLEVYGLLDKTQSNPGNLTALVWVKDENYNNFYLVNQGKTLSPINDAILNVSGLADGNYKIEWWDTNSGVVTSQVNAVSAGSVFQTAIPPVLKDIAAKIYFISTNGPTSTPATPSVTPTPCLPLGNINCSGKVDVFDLTLLLSNFGSITFKEGDLNNNGKVDVFDLMILLGNFGR